MKNEKPSIGPQAEYSKKRPTVGHSRPISKLNTVPVITPTANNVTITRDHRPASVRYT